MEQRGALHDKEVPPMINVTTLRSGQSIAPELSGVAAGGVQAAEVWSAMLEDHVVTVEPEFLATKEGHCVKGSWGSTSLSLHLPEVGNRGDEGWFLADVLPKALCKGTARDQMIRCLWGTVAQVTDIGVHNVLHLQVAFALDAPLEKKPGEELHFRRSMVLPHKLVEGAGAI